MQDKERLIGSTDLDAATITRAPLETGKLCQKRAVRSGSLTSR
jgi:hypothetical protein